MLTVQLTEMQRKNLLVFLGRIQLSGLEARAFMEIVQAVENADAKPTKEESRSGDS